MRLCMRARACCSVAYCTIIIHYTCTSTEYLMSDVYVLPLTRIVPIQSNIAERSRATKKNTESSKVIRPRLPRPPDPNPGHRSAPFPRDSLVGRSGAPLSTIACYSPVSLLIPSGAYLPRCCAGMNACLKINRLARVNDII